MRPLRVLLAALALVSALPAPVSAAEKGVQTDLTSGVNRHQRNKTVAGVQDLGADWMRLTMSWSALEETGNDSYSLLGEYDAAFESAAATGAKLVVTVHTAPQWASGRTDPDSPPLDPADYADFLRFAATRWGDKVDAWEIWNEQNSSAFWSTGPSPSGYAELLKAAYPAVKRVDPTALVVYGGVSHNDYRFIERSYAADPNLGNYYDVMATHPYPTPASLPPERTWLESDGRLAVTSFPAYREIRKVMLVNGDDKPLWFTQFGWSTNTLAGQGVSESTQAAYYTRAMRCVEQDSYVQVAIWHIYRNPSDENTWLDQLGLARTNFSKKAAYNAFKSYTPGSIGCAYEDATPQPAPESAPTSAPAPAPAPAPEPVDPEPTADPASEEDPVATSSVRSIEIRLVRRDGAAGTAGSDSRTRRRRARLRVLGSVSNARRGHVELHLRCVARGRADWRQRITRRADVSRTGQYSQRIRPRTNASCRLRVGYHAFGVRLARSQLLRFRT